MALAATILLGGIGFTRGPENAAGSVGRVLASLVEPKEAPCKIDKFRGKDLMHHKVEPVTGTALLARNRVGGHGVQQVQEVHAVICAEAGLPEEHREVGSAHELVDVLAAVPPERQDVAPPPDIWIKCLPRPAAWVHGRACVQPHVSSLLAAG